MYLCCTLFVILIICGVETKRGRKRLTPTTRSGGQSSLELTSSRKLSTLKIEMENRLTATDRIDLKLTPIEDKIRQSAKNHFTVEKKMDVKVSAQAEIEPDMFSETDVTTGEFVAADVEQLYEHSSIIEESKKIDLLSNARDNSGAEINEKLLEKGEQTKHISRLDVIVGINECANNAGSENECLELLPDNAEVKNMFSLEDRPSASHSSIDENCVSSDIDDNLLRQKAEAMEELNTEIVSSFDAVNVEQETIQTATECIGEKSQTDGRLFADSLVNDTRGTVAAKNVDDHNSNEVEETELSLLESQNVCGSENTLQNNDELSVDDSLTRVTRIGNVCLQNNDENATVDSLTATESNSMIMSVQYTTEASERPVCEKNVPEQNSLAKVASMSTSLSSSYQVYYFDYLLYMHSIYKHENTFIACSQNEK